MAMWTGLCTPACTPFQQAPLHSPCSRSHSSSTAGLQVRQRIARMLPSLRLASEKYVALVLDKRRTLVLAQRTGTAWVQELPEASETIIDNASGTARSRPPQPHLPTRLMRCCGLVEPCHNLQNSGPTASSVHPTCAYVTSSMRVCQVVQV